MIMDERAGLGTARRFRLAAVVLSATFALTGTGGSLLADQYYEVGPGQTYSTINAALAAIPMDAPWTESHVVNIHAGTYEEHVDTTGRTAYQPTPTNRLVIQANPGDDVTIQLPAPSVYQSFVVRHSNVTIQGLRFTGQSTDLNYAYLRLGQYGGALRNGYVIQNNEFIGAPAYEARPIDVGGSDASWDVAFVNNYVSGGDFHTGVPKADVAAGNVFDRMKTGSSGGGQYINLNPGGHAVNNTIVGAKTGIVQHDKTATAPTSVISNNIMVDCADRGMYLNSLLNVIPPDPVPTLSNNLQFNNGEWVQSQHHIEDLETWNTWLTNARLETEDNSLDGYDPLFEDAASGNYQLQGGSPAVNAGLQTRWADAIAHIPGLEDMLNSYWNPIRDIGYARDGTHMGALIVNPVECQ